MADGDNTDEFDKTPLSPIVGTPCDELDAAELFEGHYNNQDVFAMGDEQDSKSYLSSFGEKNDSECDSASSELEDIYSGELGVTPPRNIRRNKERSRTQRKGQGLCLKIPVKVEVEKQKKRVRESSQTQIQNERAFQREYKRSSLGSTLGNEDLSRSLNLPNVKIDSKNRFMSLKCTRRDNRKEDSPKHRLTRSESDPKDLGQSLTTLSQSRQEFIRTFSLLIKIGAHARKQRDSQFASTELERQNSEEHKKWQVKLCLALWLELRAWHGGRTMEEQDKYLMEERANVEEVLDEFIKFNLNNVVSNGDVDDNLTSVKDNVEQIVEDEAVSSVNNRAPATNASATPTVVIDDYELKDSNDKNSNNGRNSTKTDNSPNEPRESSPSSDSKPRKENLNLDLSSGGKTRLKSLKSEECMPRCSTPENAVPKDRFRKRLEFAIMEITKLFDQLESVEVLYPTKRAVGEANPKYLISEFNRNVDALLLWLNVTKELLHQLTLISRFLGIDPEMQDMWQDWIHMGMGMLGGSTESDSCVATSTTSEESYSSGSSESLDEELPSTPTCKRQLSHETWSPKPPMRSGSNISQFTWTLTSRYRPFVDRSIKKFGLVKLGKRIGDILDVTLLKTRQVLYPEGPQPKHNDHSQMSISEWHASVSHLENILYRDVATEQRPRTHSSPVIRNIVLERSPYMLPWKSIFEELGLPSIRDLYLFLARIPLDISHECIRLRLEHRPKGEPSSLSIRQLLKECKEVILGAVLVKDYYLCMVDGIVSPEDYDHEKLENDIEEFEQDLQSMLEVYFEYLHNVIHMLQRLPQASKGLKNLLEEEWVFVKHKYQHIRGGAVAGGTRFCVMAAGLLESTADFLESGLDQCCSDLHDNTDHSEDVRKKVLEACRSLKHLFNEGRERASKALGFTKKLKIDLENAAKFSIDVPVNELLSVLERTEHSQVVVAPTTGLLMFVPKHLRDDKCQIIDLLNACCGLKKGQNKEPGHGYLLVMQSSKVATPVWTGHRIIITLTVDTRISLADIQVDGLILVVNKSHQVEEQRNCFLHSMGIFVTMIKERTSSHQAISESLDSLQDAALLLGTKIINAVNRANENLDGEMFDADENERHKLCQNTVETMYGCFNFGFEYLKEIARLVSGDPRKKLGKYMLCFARKWIKFVMEKCERGRGTRPRWATQGLDFLTIAIDGKVLNSMPEAEFQQLKKQINDCISHVVGSANGGPSSSAYRPHSPAVGPSPVLGKSSGTSLRRPYSWPANRSPRPEDSENNTNNRHLSEPHKVIHFQSLAEDAKSPEGLGSEHDEEDAVSEKPKTSPVPHHKDSMDYSMAPKMEKVRHALRRLEQERNSYLVEKHVIGKVSSKHRDITSELANISNRRVPFKWQRGMKIGEGQFGKVYACVNLDSGDMMAMKQIRFHPNDHSEIKDLADEIKNFEGIQHDSLVKYYGVELHRDEMLIFMEYCADGTISDIAKLGLPESMIRQYTMQILVAVNVLHERGIIHRDVKGANIFLSSNGLIKLGDFGSSIKLKNQSKTMHGEVMNVRGTVAYMAPEIITMDKGSGYGRAADIWSTGCVVVEMATGKPPWHEYDNNWAIMFKVGDGAIPAIPDTLSEEGRDFLHSCFLHDPRERPTANDLMDHSFVKCC
ncbi:mitogen-activated protein kinase kinase kinase 4-like isoform X3 [Actinia tenebrosa]|uniref:Mitogen-activated protein kinase kinase kinase 4-like isoform X3 n=1 Tax=Actinia tenebrosa TaxID=6105 RepID=A0A6P8HDG9_ACTTE|nr:mitogen-activated protein kinase kinase kinase 4-like isoform X3 [Actinia tenebrosa]